MEFRVLQYFFGRGPGAEPYQRAGNSLQYHLEKGFDAFKACGEIPGLLARDGLTYVWHKPPPVYGGGFR